MADIDIRLRMNRRELAVLRLVLLEAESQFEAQGGQRFADRKASRRSSSDSGSPKLLELFRWQSNGEAPAQAAGLSFGMRRYLQRFIRLYGRMHVLALWIGDFFLNALVKRLMGPVPTHDSRRATVAKGDAESKQRSTRLSQPLQNDLAQTSLRMT